MKASKAIQQLQELIATFGDQEIRDENDYELIQFYKGDSWLNGEAEPAFIPLFE